MSNNLSFYLTIIAILCFCAMLTEELKQNNELIISNSQQINAIIENQYLKGETNEQGTNE